MARPETNWITFEIDGRQVRAPEGAMLVDAAKHGDVEIPYFCYEPKLGQPVGACRMCLVEIEGIPKLQTSCSTPVRDGMVVNTTSDRVKQAQNAMVEFLLVNHPLDCPVCDKGGECPLQDISYGWGAGHSRFIDPKRHFKKPLELSPLVAIDRERCILCYRCVRFSQEIAEDYQLVFLERGDHTFVGTHDGRPYVAPFSGNIIELCPVGALTSTAYRFRARPWDIEGSGTVCTLCPSQCNVELTVRDDAKVVRVLARDNEEVDDGWLCDKGRFGYQSFGSPERLTAPLVRDGGFLRPVSWERALSEAARLLKRAGERTAALVGGTATNEEGFLVQHLLREGLGSAQLASAGAVVSGAHARALANPALGAEVADIDHAGAILVLDTELVEEAPILDLRVRKAVRRNGARLVVASSRPRRSTRTPRRPCASRRAPSRPPWGRWRRRSAARARRARWTTSRPRRAPPRASAPARRPPTAPGRAPRPTPCVPPPTSCATRATWSSSGASASPPASAAPRRSRRCWRSRLARRRRQGRVGADRRSPPAPTGAACARSAVRPASGRASRTPTRARRRGHRPPLFEAALPEAELDRYAGVVAFASFRDDALDEHADVVFPAPVYAEKEGTSPIPTGASSGCARRSATEASRAPRGGCSPSCASAPAPVWARSARRW